MFVKYYDLLIGCLWLGCGLWLKWFEGKDFEVLVVDCEVKIWWFGDD